MIIYQSTTTLTGNTIYLSAKVHIDNKQKSYPEELWFCYPKKFSEILTKSANPFTSSLFLLAGYLGEDMEIKSTLSPRLLWGLQEYLDTFNVWFPDTYTQIKIKCDGLLKSKTTTPLKTAVSFSGGVDSFYTLLRNTLDKSAILPISYAIFLHGFDIPLEDTASYEIAVANYEPMLNSFGVEMIPVATNVREFIGQLNWNNIYGSLIAGVVFSLEEIFQYYFFPSTQDNYLLLKEGTDPRLVPLLATETTSIILEAGNVARPEKTAYITNYPITYDNLRVCWEKIKGVNNCGQCEKCLRTMTEIELTGNLEKYTTFQEPLNNNKISHVNLYSPLIKNFWNDISVRAKLLKRNDIVRSIRIAKIRTAWNGLAVIKKLKKLNFRIIRKIRRVFKLKE